MSVSGLQIVGSVLVTSCLDKMIRCYDLAVGDFIITLLYIYLIRGCLHDTGATFSPRSEFTPVPAHGSIFVYMIPPQNVVPARVTPA